MKRIHSEPLARHTSFRIGGPTETFVQPESVDELATLVAELDRRGTPRFVLGGGTNVLMGDRGFDGVVISTSRLLGIDWAEPTLLRAEAGVPLKRVIKRSLHAEMEGVETLLGIPGSIGGAVWGNAGAVDYAVGDRVESVTLVGSGGRIERVSAADLDFRYRSSRVGTRVVAEVFLRLVPTADPEALRARALEVFSRKLASQPLAAYSAGCVFRNPPGAHAAQLIDRCGLKGLAVGGARVSDRHANFIVNDHKATAGDVEILIETVRRRVHQQFGHWLEREIICAGHASQQEVEVRS